MAPSKNTHSNSAPPNSMQPKNVQSDTTQLGASRANDSGTTSEVPLTTIEVQLTGEDGNAFAIIGRVRNALRQGGRADLVDSFTAEATAGDYDRLLQVCQRYVHCS